MKKSKVQQLISHVEEMFKAGNEYAYVDVGKHQGYSVSTLRGLKDHGYRIERRVLGGAYHVYPKPSEPLPEKTYLMPLTEGEIIAIRELVRKFPHGNELADNYADELYSLDKKTTAKLADIFDEMTGLKILDDQA
jgi:hypothetical protein